MAESPGSSSAAKVRKRPPATNLGENTASSQVAASVKRVVSLEAARQHKGTGSVPVSEITSHGMLAAGDLNSRLSKKGTTTTEKKILLAHDIAAAQSLEHTLNEKAVRQSIAAGSAVMQNLPSTTPKPPRTTPASKKRAPVKGDAKAASSSTSAQLTQPQLLGTTEKKMYTGPMYGYGSAIPEPVVLRTVSPQTSHGGPASSTNGMYLDVAVDDAIVHSQNRGASWQPADVARVVSAAGPGVISVLRPELTPDVSPWDLASGSAGDPMDVDPPSNVGALVNQVVNAAQLVKSSSTRSKRRRPSSVGPLSSELSGDESIRNSVVAEESMELDGGSSVKDDTDHMDVDAGPATALDTDAAVVTIYGLTNGTKRQKTAKATSTSSSSSSSAKNKSIPKGAIVHGDPRHIAGQAGATFQSAVMANKKQLMTKPSDVTKELHGIVSSVQDATAMVPQTAFEQVAHLLKDLFVPSDSGQLPAGESAAYDNVRRASQEPLQFVSTGDLKHVLSSLDSSNQIKLFYDRLDAVYREQLSDDILQFWSRFDPAVFDGVYDEAQRTGDADLLSGGIDVENMHYKHSADSSAQRRLQAQMESKQPSNADAPRKTSYDRDRQHHDEIIGKMARFNAVYRAIAQQEKLLVDSERPCFSNRKERLADDLLARGELPSCPVLTSAYLDGYRRSYRPAQVAAKRTFLCDNGLDCVLRVVGIGQSGGSFYTSKVQTGFTTLNSVARALRGRTGIGVTVSASGASTVQAARDESKTLTRIGQNGSNGATPLIRSDLSERLLCAVMRPAALARMTDESRLQLAQMLMRASLCDSELEKVLDGSVTDAETVRDRQAKGWSADEGFIGVQLLLPEEEEQLKRWIATSGSDESSRNPLLDPRRDGLCYYCYCCEVNERNNESVQGVAYKRHRDQVNINIHPTNGHFLPLNKFQVEVDVLDGYPRDACISPTARSPGKNMVIGHFPIFVLNNLWVKDARSHYKIEDAGANFCLSSDK